jgi:hypothetical protein
LASETDHLPFGEVRSRWSDAALSKADAEIEAITEGHRMRVRQACENVIARFSAGKRTVTLYRPVGPKEYELIAASGWREFPPRLPDQPIFYPVTNEPYAIQIARDWNVKAELGCVDDLQFLLSRFATRRVSPSAGSVPGSGWRRVFQPATDPGLGTRVTGSKD